MKIGFVRVITVVALVASPAWDGMVSAGTVRFRRGDSNADGAVDLSDAVDILSYLFLGSRAPGCLDAADADANGAVELTDAVYALAYLFLAGSPPPAPGPTDCGVAEGPSLGCQNYPGCGNTPPAISQGPLALPPTVDAGQATTLSLTANDPDGDPLRFSWAQVSPPSSPGTFDDPGALGPTWTAPAVSADTTFVLRVMIDDGNGNVVTGDVSVLVKKVNGPPVLQAGPSASPSQALPGDSISLGVTAQDPDGDPVTLSWSQVEPATPKGTFPSGAKGASVVWIPPAVGSQTVFKLQVSASDGINPPVTGSVPVTVTVPSYKTDIQPIWDQNCTGCHAGRFPSGNLTLQNGKSLAALVNVSAGSCSPGKRVLPGDPDNSVLYIMCAGFSCGDRMPQDNPTFFDGNPDLLAEIRSWILAGAPND